MGKNALDGGQLRDLIPGVLAVLVHRGADFATAEDAVQEALIRAWQTWETSPDQRPDDPRGWLITTAWRRFIDLTRSDIARHDREQRVSEEPAPGPTESADDPSPCTSCAHTPV
jgi:DNA-directed RNA polymerase specialized sigma24 family protein